MKTIEGARPRVAEDITQLVGETPILRLKRLAEPPSADVFAKLEYLNPGGSVKADTGSGNIKLYGVKGGLNAQAGSGNIYAEGEPTGDWRMGAGSGNITLKVPTQASFNLDAVLAKLGPAIAAEKAKEEAAKEKVARKEPDAVAA